MEGAYRSVRKDGSVYYRSSINYKSTHVSLGSYATEEEASQAYQEARSLYFDEEIGLENFHDHIRVLPVDKIICILNHRDHGMYLKTPIYMQKDYIQYYLTEHVILKFDTDDLFYYATHKILRRQGSLYVNDYGCQYRVLSRYGIKNYAVPGRDYIFVNGDQTDYRSVNLLVLSHYHGVIALTDLIPVRYETKIHLNGDFRIGIFDSEEVAAIAYNKAADYARDHGFDKEFPQNYVEEVLPAEYASIYTEISLPRRFRRKVKEMALT